MAAPENTQRGDGNPSPAYAELDDRELVRRTVAGESAAYDQLTSRYADKVYRLAFKVLRHEQDAEDAVQDAFLSAFRNLPRFREKSTFSTWLYRVAMNAALMRLRKRRPGFFSIDQPASREDGPSVIELPDWSQSPVGDLMNTEIREAVQRAVANLPEDLQTAFVLREYQGVSNSDAAEELGISVPAVKSRLHRARVALRDELGRFFADRSGRAGAKRA